MRAYEALTYEPAACWRRLQAAKHEFFFEDLDQLMKERHGQFLEELMGYERQCFINAHPYQRCGQRVDQANGFYPRQLTTRLGVVGLKVPRTRSGRFHPQVLVRYQRREPVINQALKAVFLLGVSTRQTGHALASLVEEAVSASTVSAVAKALDVSVSSFHRRRLSDDAYRYLILDGVSVRIRLVGKVQRRLALCASANTTPTITGTPLAGGYTATVASTTGSAGHVDLVVCPAITLTPASLPGGTVGGGYSQSLTSTGGTPPYSFAVTTGSLPAGLSLSGSGSLNGTPSAIGTNTFTVTATDTNGCTGSQAYTLVVGGPVSWTWNGSVSTDWFNPNNWTPVGVPGPNDTVNFASGTINLTAPVTFSGQFNWSGGTLSGNPLTITSNAMVDVSGSAFLSGTLNSTNATVGIIGTVASLTLSGGTILGGTVVATNGASLIVSSGTLDGVTFNGMLDVGNTYNGAVLTVTDGLVLDGTALVGNPTNTWTGQINFVGSQSLGGNGTIVFGNGWTYNYQGWNVVGLANGGTTLTIGPGITIRGQNGLVGAGNGWVGGPQNVGVINQGTISPDSGGTINIAAQPFTNQGVVQANSGGSLSISGLQNGVGAAVTLNGGGSLSLGGGWANAGTINATNVTVNLGGSFTLADLGTLNRSGGLVSVTGTLSNTNTVLVLDALGGSCVLTGGTILGGTVVATNGASLIVSSGTLDGVTFNGMLDVGNTYNGAVLTVTDGLVLDGTALVGNPTNTWTGQINFVGSQSLGGNGTIVFGNGWTYNYQGWNVVGLANGGTTLTIGPGITIRGQNGLVGAGNGWVGGPQNVGVINQGTISPDSGGTIIVGGQSVINQGTVSALQGAINFNNGLALNGGTLNFGISGPSSFGTMSVSGAANLGGGLSAVLLGGYVPAIGATFDVMTFASTNGAFTNYSGLNVGSGRVLVPLLSSTNLTLQAELPCPTITVGPPSLPSGTDGAGYSQSLTASGGAGPYSFTNSAGSLPAGLSLSGSGSLSGTPTGAGTNAFTVTAMDTNGCTGSQAYTLVISKAGATVTLGNLSQPYDGAAENASFTTAPPGLAVNLTYNGSANAPTNVGSYLVVGTINDPNYQGSATNTLVIGKASATVTAYNTTRAYGQSNLVFGGTTAGFSSADNITATYNCSATTNSPPGAYPIVPSLNDPNNRLGNYNVTTNNGTLTILPAASMLAWAAPAAVIYGTALSSNQLNASASVPGSFTYSPTNGSVLSAGTNLLSVVFTPSNSNDYSGASISVNLVVLPAALSVTANSTARLEGQANPVFTGTITGLTNGDNITPVYSCSATAASPAGTYPIVATLQDPGGRLGNYNVTTNNGTLTVNAGNDMFANRETISGVSNTVYSSNINATKEPGEPDHAGNPGGASLWWTWTAQAQGLVTLSTIGSSFETLLAVYTGDSVSNLTVVATNIDSGGDHTSLLTFVAAAGVTYQIAVDGFNDSTNAATGNIVLNLLEVYGPPQFVAQPQSQTVPAGAGVIFTASAQGSQPLWYQWLQNGVALPGATNAQYGTNTFYSITSAQTNNIGSYTVVVSNSFGSAVSSSAVLNVFTRPGNDNYANAFPFNGLTNSVTGNNVNATPDCAPGTNCFEPALFAGHSVWWTWTAPTNGTVVVDTSGSSFETVLAVYTNGASGPVLIAYDDQSGSNNTSRLQFDTPVGVTYYFGVDGSIWAAANATTGNIVVNLEVFFLPPQITLQPQPQTAEAGWSLSFNVAATGTTPLSYQWNKDGAALPGATATTYAIGSAQASDAGNYSVTVSNAFGSVTSSNALLTFYAAPVNDMFANATSLPSVLSNTVVGVNIGATKEPGEPNHAGNSGGRSVWWTWTAPSSGTVVIDTIGSSFDTLLAVYTGNSVSSLSLVAANDNSGGNLTSRVVFSATMGTPYRIAVDGYYPTGTNGAAYGNIVLNLQESVVLAPLVLSQPQSQAVAAGGSVTFSAAAAGTPAPVYQWLFNGVPLAGKTNATLQLNNVTTNQTGAYSVLFSNVAGSVTSASATLRVETVFNPGFLSDWPGFETGDALDVAVADGLAYVATSAGFLVLDVGNPANPRRIGAYNTDSPATRIAAQDGFVYLLTSSNQLSGATLSRFDARNPGLPKKVAQYVSSAASDFALADDLLCAVDGQSLLVLNTNCALLASLDTANGIAGGVVISNGNAYVTWPNFIGVYSLTNPAAPAQVASLTQSQAELALASGYLYALTGGQRVVQLRVLDPGSPQRPQVGFSSVSNALGHADQQALAVSSNAVYVVTAGYDGNALGVYTPLGQPWNPTLVGTNLFADGTPQRVAADSGYVYVANGGTGLKIFDMSNLAHPAPTGQFFTAVQANSVVLQGNQAYVLDINSGFHILDVSDPTAPVSLGAYQSSGAAAAIAVKNHYVYLALNAPPTLISISGPSLQVIDIANSDSPLLLGSVSLPGPALASLPQPGDPSVQVTALAVSGNLVLVNSELNGSAAVGIVDVSAPASPRVVGRFDLPGTAQIASIDFQAPYAYLADADFGLRVLNLGNPATPVQAGSFAESSSMSSVSVQSNLCLLSGAYGSDLLDVTQPGHPVRIGANSITGTLEWLQPPLALGSGPDGIQVFDLLNFASPLLIGQFAGAYGAVTVQGRYAFAAGAGAGLTILDLGSSFATPPSILAPPPNLRVLEGVSTNFFVAAGGTVPLSYQWSMNGTNLTDGGNISGSQTESLNLAHIQASDAGTYSVQIANGLAPAASAVAILSVDLPPSVTLTTPTDQEILSPPATIPLAAQAEASDAADTIAQVAFYNGASLIGIVTTPPFSLVWSNVPCGTYPISAVATDNEGATNASTPATVTVTNLPVFQFSSANYTAYESNGVVSVTILRSSGDTEASVDFQTLDFSATAVGSSGGIGNYYAVSTNIDFAVGQTATNVQIQLVQATVYRGQPVFNVVLFNPGSGWSLANPSTAAVGIVDDNSPATTNSFTDVVPASPPPPHGGSLTTTLLPPAANGQWRFEWETAWRLSGSTATNLSPGAYSVVFQQLTGWVAPQETIYVVGTNANESVTNYYASSGGAATGSLAACRS